MSASKEVVRSQILLVMSLSPFFTSGSAVRNLVDTPSTHVEPPPDSFWQGDLNEILGRIKEKRPQIIEPRLSHSGIVFPGFEDYSFDRVLLALERLEQEGIATRRPTESLLACPSCQSFSLAIRYLCVSCRSPNISRGSVIEHLPCGNVETEDKFKRSDGSLVCPKCGKILTAIGVDYSKPGLCFKCQDCVALLPAADIQNTCIKCGLKTMIDALKEVQLYGFGIDYSKLSTQVEDNGQLKEIVEALTKIGIKSESPSRLQGRSMVTHTFELVVFGEANAPILVADAITTSDNTEESESIKVMAFHARCDDVAMVSKGSITRVLVAVPSLSAHTRRLAETYGMVIIECPRKDYAVSGIVQLILTTYTQSRKTKQV